MSKLSQALPIEDCSLDSYDTYPCLTAKFQSSLIIQSTMTNFEATKLLVWNIIHYPSTEYMGFTSNTVAVFTVRKKAS